MSSAPGLAFPCMVQLEQNFECPPAIDLDAAIDRACEHLRPRLKAGDRIAVALGSRGIDNLQAIVRRILQFLIAAGTRPFIIPAMGSHGGATPEGQASILSEYGISESALGVPVRPSLEVQLLGTTGEAFPVYCSVEALQADGILIVNRIKPHTDFFGKIGSGILKMAVIGLGKKTGAAAAHYAASLFGHETVIRSIARELLQRTRILGGIALLEDQLHHTALVDYVPPERLETREEELFQIAKRWMPRLPFNEIDLLIVDRIGKNISGAGLDPNIINRGVNGYSSELRQEGAPSPFIRRIFVRDLTPETHGNAIGIGMADVTTSRLVRAMDQTATYVNALTALTPQGAKIPIHFESDREAIALILGSLAQPDRRQIRVVRIADTLSLKTMQISEALLPIAQQLPALRISGTPREMTFDPSGNLPCSPQL